MLVTSALNAAATGGSLRDGLTSRLRDAAPSLARLRHDGGILLYQRRVRRVAVESNTSGAYATSGHAARAAMVMLRVGTAGGLGAIAARGTSADAGSIATAAASRREGIPAVVMIKPGAHATVRRRVARVPLESTND
jgi:hypothetical protein